MKQGLLNAGYFEVHFFFFIKAGPPRPGRADLARFSRLTLGGKSAGHEVASLADLPTKAS